MPTAYEIETGILYDEALGQRSTGTWHGYSLIGVTAFPYPLGCDEVYPGTEQGITALKALELDTQDENVVYPRYKFGKDDTGRILRWHFTDGGADFSLHTAADSLLIYSYKQSDNTVIRNGVDLATIGGVYPNDGTDGYAEWNLAATDTAQSFYYKLVLSGAGRAYTFPTSGYLYADAFDHTSTAGQTGGYGAVIRLRTGDYAKGYAFTLKEASGAECNLDGASVVAKFGKPSGYAITPTTVAATGEGYGGSFTYTRASGNFASTGSNYMWFTITTRNSKTISVPSDRHLTVEVE